MFSYKIEITHLQIWFQSSQHLLQNSLFYRGAFFKSPCILHKVNNHSCDIFWLDVNVSALFLLKFLKKKFLTKSSFSEI